MADSQQSWIVATETDVQDQKYLCFGDLQKVCWTALGFYMIIALPQQYQHLCQWLWNLTTANEHILQLQWESEAGHDLELYIFFF
jgi:hypothetical protein